MEKEKLKVRTVERGSVLSVHSEVQLLHDGRYYCGEEGIQTAGIAQSAGSSQREKWEGANHVTAFNVVYPDSAICFRLCSVDICIRSIPVTNYSLNKCISISCRECQPERLPWHSQ